jgi:hypothetical protein
VHTEVEGTWLADMVVACTEVARTGEDIVAAEEMQWTDLYTPVALMGRFRRAGWGRLGRWV